MQAHKILTRKSRPQSNTKNRPTPSAPYFPSSNQTRTHHHHRRRRRRSHVFRHHNLRRNPNPHGRLPLRYSLSTPAAPPPPLLHLPRNTPYHTREPPNPSLPNSRNRHLHRRLPPLLLPPPRREPPPLHSQQPLVFIPAVSRPPPLPPRGRGVAQPTRRVRGGAFVVEARNGSISVSRTLSRLLH